MNIVKLPQCDRCLYYINNHHLLCAAHPSEPQGDTCIDFSPNPELQGKRFTDFLGLLQRNVEYLDSSESFSNPFNLKPDKKLWEPVGASYYAGELILQPQVRWTREEQLADVQRVSDTSPAMMNHSYIGIANAGGLMIWLEAIVQS